MITSHYDKRGKFQWAYEEIRYAEKELAGYMYAGMRAKHALKKYGGAAMAKDFAERLVAQWFAEMPFRLRRGRALVKRSKLNFKQMDKLHDYLAAQCAVAKPADAITPEVARKLAEHLRDYSPGLVAELEKVPK